MARIRCENEKWDRPMIYRKRVPMFGRTFPNVWKNHDETFQPLEKDRSILENQ